MSNQRNTRDERYIELGIRLLDGVNNNNLWQVTDALERGADVDFIFDEKLRVFEQAIQNGNIAIIQSLIIHGALDPTQKEIMINYANMHKRADVANVIDSWLPNHLAVYRKNYLRRLRGQQHQQILERQFSQRQQQIDVSRQREFVQRRDDLTELNKPVILDRANIFSRLTNQYGQTVANYINYLLSDTDSPEVIPELLEQIQTKLDLDESNLEKQLSAHFQGKRVSPWGAVQCRNEKSLIDLETLMSLESDDDLVVDSSSLCYTKSEL